MLAHAEIVVRAPHGDLAAAAMIEGAREGAGPPLQIGEYPVMALGPERIEARLEKAFVIHGLTTSPRGPRRSIDRNPAAGSGGLLSRQRRRRLGEPRGRSRRSSSSISAPVMMSGGQKAMVSPMARRMTPVLLAFRLRPARRRRPSAGNGALVALSRTSSIAGHEPDAAHLADQRMVGEAPHARPGSAARPSRTWPRMSRSS